jgi:hypothetical protein
MKRRLIASLILTFGFVAVWGAYRGWTVKHAHWIEVLGILGFAICLICASIPNLLGKDALIELIANNKWVRMVYAFGSLGMTVTSASFAWQFWGWNITTVFGLIGVVFFGLGVLVILYFDYSSLKKYMQVERNK